jgi:capsular exopolysaccharide synthesis family protein
MDTEQSGLSLEQVGGILRRRGYWILLCCILAAGAAYGLSKREPKKYTASAAVAFNTNSLGQEIAGLPSANFSNSSSLAAQENSNIDLLKGSGETAIKTARTVGNGVTAQEVASSISVTGQGESSVVGVSATTGSPDLAAAIANAYVRQFVREQQSTNRAFFNSALAVVNRQLAKLRPAERFGADGLDLQNRAHTLSLLAQLGYNDAEVAQEALPPASASSPKVTRDTVLGLILGLLLGLAVALTLERFDRRIVNASDLEQIYGVPLLGSVPKSTSIARANGGKAAGTEIGAREAGAFDLIRARLRFFNVDRNLRTIVVASPTTGDGKTTIARHLAQAAAASGSRTLLIEADMRQPALARRLGIAADPGLADLLAGGIALEAAIQPVAIAASRRSSGLPHAYDVMPAGSVSQTDAAALLESGAMSALLDEASSSYDIVVLDTPALNAVPDAFPLLSMADGVIIVGYVSKTRRDATQELKKVLAGSGAPLLGVIANGATSAASIASGAATPARPARASRGTGATEEYVPSAET